MILRMSWLAGCVLALGALCTVAQEPVQTSPATEPRTTAAEQKPSGPVLIKRPEAKAAAPSAVVRDGRIGLDVLVTDAAGKPVVGLEPWDFTVTDNGEKRKILSFRSCDGVQVKPDPPDELILLIDRVNLTFQQTAMVRRQVRLFLNANGGKLATPTSIMFLTDAGLRVQERPSMDGKALTEALDAVDGNVHIYTSAMGGEGSVERMKVSVRALLILANNEVKRPGRKLLMWIGPGRPLLSNQPLSYTAQTRRDQLNNFDTAVALTNRLREARITLYSLGGRDEFYVRDELKPARTVDKMLNSSVALQVAAVHSGGRTVDAGNYSDLAVLIERFRLESQAFYRLSFDPPAGARAEEYHDLKVEVGKAGGIARTTSGYYTEP